MVVQDAYTRFNEDSTTQSQCDSTTTKTEVDIKGLEVSKNLLEMSDSGVEFSAPGLPLDSDTDVPPTYTCPKIQVPEPSLSNAPASEANMGTAPVRGDQPSTGPMSEALLEAAQPGESTASPVQDTSKENTAT
ncbi:hypothetical protein SKAU_G00224960 [Synaphobranchus kaupii]|uniref:Uncharacterized protein n=1 Tax=Synaphobranchus kaupii TaxID=118154 RepID=A0A9Q1FBU4_SYNKA|nr:hypothetical protein SKAU_G00224960 [Synaphobranchus kaupii]